MNIDLGTNRFILPTLHNARDLGGLETAYGKTTAYGRFVRSDEPCFLSTQDLEQLIAYPIRTVIDLRSAEEIARRGNPFIGRDEILYRNISLFESDPDVVNDATVKLALDNSLGDLYIYLLERRPEQLAEVFFQILEAPEGAVLFHCTHGKDRTGVIAALLLSLVQVPRKDIVRNYAVTYDYIRPLVDPKLAVIPPQMHHLYKSDAQNMEMFLNYLDENYEGKSENYLKSIGLSGRDIDRLRERIL